ncbi:MAG: hypothetical protein H0V12_03310 [Chloroflexi bacterium]|nr:hypothetical protein [Chloroflexota bacterium]
MRVIAATFSDRPAATRVLNELRGRYELSADDADVAPLGTYGGSRETLTVLAGRFWEDRVVEVAEIIGRNGGELVADIDERWTHARTTGGSAQRPASGPTREAPPELTRFFLGR